jgi:hypothetical protein
VKSLAEVEALQFTVEDIAEFGDLSYLLSRRAAYRKLFAAHRSRAKDVVERHECNVLLHAKISEFLREQVAVAKAERKERQEMASNPYAYLLKERR